MRRARFRRVLLNASRGSSRRRVGRLRRRDRRPSPPPLVTWREVHVVDRGEHGERQGGQKRDDPDDRDDAHGSLQPGHGVRVERMTDGQVPFHRKSHDGQHRRVRSPVRGTRADAVVRIKKKKNREHDYSSSSGGTAHTGRLPLRVRD